MLEGKDINGYVWIQDLRYDDYFYLKDFENLVVSKVFEQGESQIAELWEAVVYEDEKCQTIIGRETFATKELAQKCLEDYVEISLKNRDG